MMEKPIIIMCSLGEGVRGGVMWMCVCGGRSSVVQHGIVGLLHLQVRKWSNWWV